MLSRFVRTVLWGNSVALAWTWGIGLFFSVQVAIQFGFKSLIAFATIDAIGLSLFGIINDRISQGYGSAEAYESSFLTKARNFKFALFFYQFLAITLTLFCCLKYITLPLGILSILVATVFIGATIFLGEEFPIERIKYSHAAYSLLVFTAIAVILGSELFTQGSLLSANLSSSADGVTAHFAINKGFTSWLEQAWAFPGLYKFDSQIAYYAFGIPLVIGFLCGPWVDLQNWQRVIQIHKEGLSLTWSYVAAGLIFWSVIVASGMLALACYQYSVSNDIAIYSGDLNSFFFSFKATITQLLNAVPSLGYVLGFYILLVAAAVLATFDSGYIAYKWYTESLVKDSNNIIFSFVPQKLICSPILWFTSAVVTAIVALHFTELGKFIASFDASLFKFFRIELEYFMAFYAAFFVVYAVCIYRNMEDAESDKRFSALKLFSTALSSIAVFGIGYFSEKTTVMALGSLLPFVYAWFTVTKAEEHKPVQTKDDPQLIQAGSIDVSEQFRAQEVKPVMTGLPEGAEAVSIKGCYIKDSWFVHQFIPTYQDTNSVGNVYFAMYLMWVGKTRELFFAHVVPDFDPNTSDYLILTRNIEHKFQKEIKEFDEVSIQIRISDYNRKFVTLEHRILDVQGELIGKGKQALMFVDSKDYGLIDLPLELQKGFIPFVTEVKEFLQR